MTLIVGLMASLITVKPPNTTGQRRFWLVLFMAITAAAIFCTLISAHSDSLEKLEDKKDKAELNRMVSDLRDQSNKLLNSNPQLYARLDALEGGIKGLSTRSGPSSANAGTCLQSLALAKLHEVNTFLKERYVKSPANDPSTANDPLYSKKQERYEQETARLYLQRFWPSMQEIFQRATQESITPGYTSDWARETPDDRWWEAMLKPGYKELSLIAQQAPQC
jgi:hypothetical protein